MIFFTMRAGSHAHGINTANSDQDFMSIYTVPLTCTLGIQPYKDVYVDRTAADGQRSTKDDVDHPHYELRHFMRLAMQGNPNMLLPFFIDERNIMFSSQMYWDMRGLADDVVSKQALKRHYGYLLGQRERMLGLGRQSKVPNRPELIEKFGYDTKYAGHALRLGLQGVELAETGKLTLPTQHAKLLLSVRNGSFSKDEVLAMIDDTAEKLDKAIKTSYIQDEPKDYVINEFLIDAQLGKV